MTNLNRHPIPAEVEMADWTLDVTGTVETTLSHTYPDLRALSLETVTDDFFCEEGWVAEDLTWRGIRVKAVLDHATPSESSRYGLVHALDSDYACSVSIDRLRESILALELDGSRLDPEHGGPARLVPTDADQKCWESVKWVSEIELLEEQPTVRDTAHDLAVSRLE